MKNYKIQSYILLLVLIVFGTSCNKYLDEAPDNRIEVDNIDAAAKVIANAYTQASYVFTDIYTDLAGPVGNPNDDGLSETYGGNTIDNQDLQTYKWEDVTALFQESPTFYWDESYTAIAHTNEVLSVIDGIETENQEKKDAIKGEALISRAYHHFMLVNLFGLHYDENASSNLGVPYILKPEVEFLPSYKRNTVAEVYDLVEKDLLEGLALINDKFFIGTKKHHFTKKAAQAFASRFYLWKKDYANCIKYSDLFLGDSPETYIKDYNSIQGSGYNETANNYGDPTDPSNLLVISQVTSYIRRTNGFRLNNGDVNRVYRNPLSSRDTRLANGIWRAGTDARYLARLKEEFFKENLSSATGTPYYIAVVFKGEEVILNRAEAYLYMNMQDKALTDINILANNRYGNTFTDISPIINFYSPVDPETNQPILLSEQEAIKELILHERKKEFWDHGLRWFDIKRHNIAVTHVLPISEGGESFTLTETDLRKAIQIPNDALSFGLTPNPR
ncbi:RagB/SusD family nutrient uptake outer membrane protein [Aquimarina longa]|uniref:RagB/SusD family nutrient uptake outer membrane protein n=1 Tax=Aquimarina longa TaxID=1080221 RepID=UPI000783E31C|nr:RagB/SusD family nutrient uptake outer membrane protein [Aquimarina longa]